MRIAAKPLSDSKFPLEVNPRADFIKNGPGWPENEFVAKLSNARLEVHDRWQTVGLSIMATTLTRKNTKVPGGGASLWLEPAQANALLKATGSFDEKQLNGKFAVVQINDRIMSIVRGLEPADPIISAAKAHARQTLAEYQSPSSPTRTPKVEID